MHNKNCFQNMLKHVSYIFQCPQCHQQIDDQNKSRIVTETCGHSKCRNCFIKEESGCVKCQSSQMHYEPIKEPPKVNNNKATDVAFKDKNKSKDIRIIEDVIIKPSEGSNLNGSSIVQFPRLKEFRKFNYPSHICWKIVNGETLFECKICNKTFKSKSNRKYHLYCDKSVEKPFNCTRCAKRFATKNHLKYHENRHNNIQHVCTYGGKECDRTFVSLVSLRKHLKIHSDDCKYICDNCDKVFYNKSELILHMYKHSKIPLPFHCRTCNKSFAAKFKLNQHQLIHRGVKSHSCELCGKKFSRNSTLTMHMLTHSNLQIKYECSVCSKSFERQRSRDRHMKIKHGSTSFRCPLCGVTSGRKDNILRHIRNLHSDENFDEVAKNITKNPIRHKIKRSKAPSGKVVDLILNVDHITKECDVTETQTLAVCQYQSVIKFAGRPQTPHVLPSSIDEIEEKAVEDLCTIEEKAVEDLCTLVTDSSSNTENIPEQFNKELRIELIEPTEPDSKISNHSIYLQLLSPYLKPPPNLDIRNGISERNNHRGFRKSQIDRLPLRKDNVDIYRSILMNTDEENQTAIQDSSSDLHENSKLPNIKTESRVTHGQSKEYFSEMHWRKRTSQCFSQNVEIDQ